MAAGRPRTSVPAALEEPSVAIAGTGGLVKAATRGLGDAVGLDSTDAFTWSGLLAEVWRPRAAAEIEEYLAAGTRRSTPAIAQVAGHPPRPYFFLRAFALGLLAYGLLYGAWLASGNVIFLPGLLVAGSFAVPLAILVFFYELNAPRNVSLLLVVRLVVFGGTGALASSLLLSRATPHLHPWLGTSAVGFVSEVGKLAIVVLITSRFSQVRYRYSLNGILFGAAVGAGFSTLETAGFAMQALLDATVLVDGKPAFGFAEMVTSLHARALTSVADHTIWGAMTAGALWRVKGARSFAPAMLADTRFLRIFGLAVLAHLVWNFQLAHLPVVVEWIKMAALALLCWTTIVCLVNDGHKQLRRERAVAVGPGARAAAV